MFTNPKVVLWFNYGIIGYNNKIMAWRWHPPRQIACCANAKPNVVPCLTSININDYPETGSWIPHPIRYG